ncbi:hypothetical protein TWF281_001600 [Arthrobotrys megalospora]
MRMSSPNERSRYFAPRPQYSPETRYDRRPQGYGPGEVSGSQVGGCMYPRFSVTGLSLPVLRMPLSKKARLDPVDDELLDDSPPEASDGQFEVSDKSDSEGSGYDDFFDDDRDEYDDYRYDYRGRREVMQTKRMTVKKRAKARMTSQPT